MERRQLKDANAELTRQSREINTFYHTVSHELKTPITAIREFSSLLSDEVLGPVNEAQADALATMVQCCDRLTMLVNDLFDAARIETGKLSLELRSGDLETLIHSNVELMRARAQHKGLQLTCDVDVVLPLIRVDADRLGQVLTNLIGNAIKFSPAGGRVRVHAGLNPNREVVVTVQDDGDGVALEHQELIFERMYQAQEDDAAAHNGMGIGLYLCKQIIELHGGTIGVESTPGAGSRFSFTLPRSVHGG